MVLKYFVKEREWLFGASVLTQTDENTLLLSHTRQEHTASVNECDVHCVILKPDFYLQYYTVWFLKGSDKYLKRMANCILGCGQDVFLNTELSVRLLVLVDFAYLIY